MTRLASALGLLLAIAATLPAAPVPKASPDPTKDREGNSLPKGATARLGSLAYRGPTMYGLTFSPDGKKLHSISAGGHVLAWDADTGKSLPVLTFKPPTGKQIGVNGAVVGDRVVWLSVLFDARKPEDCTAVTYRLDGTEVSRFQFPGSHPNFSVMAHQTPNASVSADGKYLATLTDEEKVVAVYDLDAGKSVFRHAFKQRSREGVHLSPDGTTLYLVGGGPVQRFEVKTGKELPEVADTDKLIDCVVASADGKLLVTRGTVLLKDEKGNVHSVVRAEELVVRDPVANKTLGKLPVGATVVDFQFAWPDALIVLAAKYRSPVPPVLTFSRWNLATLKREWEVPAPPGLGRLAASADGKRFAASDRTTVAHVYDAATGKPVVEPRAHAGQVSWVGFSPDGGRVTTLGPDGARHWAVKDGESKGTIHLPEFDRGNAQPASYSPSLLGEHLVWVTRSEDGKVAELVGWDRAKDAIGWRLPLTGAVPERVLTSDGKRCVGFSWNKAKQALDATVFDGPAGKTTHAWTLPPDTGGDASTWPLSLSRDGAILFVGKKGGVAGLDATTGKERSIIDIGPFRMDDLRSIPMAVSADGTRLAVATRYEKTGVSTLRVYEVKTGNKLGEHKLGQVHHPALRFSPNGKHVAAWNMWDTAVLLCDAESSQTDPRKLDGGTIRATAAAFSPNGASLVVGYQDGTALVWNLAAK